MVLVRKKYSYFLAGISKICKSYFFHRIVVAAFYFTAILLAAKYIKIVDYASILNIVFLSKFLQILNLGTVSGYFVSTYSLKDNKISRRTAKINFFQGLLSHYLIICLLLLLMNELFKTDYILTLLSFMILSPLYALEPYLRSKQVFSFSLAPDFVLAAALLATVGLSISGSKFDSSVIFVIVAGLFSLVVFFSCTKKRLYLFRKFKIRYSFMWDIMKVGMPVFISSALFVLMTGADRLFIPYHQDEKFQTVYFLSFQLVSGFMIVSVSLNFINTVKIGELLNKSVDSTLFCQLSRFLKHSFAVNSISLILLLIFSVIIENYFLEDYNGLIFVVFFIGIGFSVFYIAGSVTPVLGYIGAQRPATKFMLAMTVISLLINLIVLYFDIEKYWLAVSTGLLLTTQGLFSLIFTFVKLKAYSTH